MAGEQVKESKNILCLFPFAYTPVRPIYLFPHHAATGWMGLRDKVCECVCVCVFKGRLCLAETIKHIHLGEDGQLCLCVFA